MRLARRFGIDITTAEDGDYTAAVARVKKAGARVTSLSLPWDEIETAPGVFAPKSDWLQIANAFYPAVGLSVALTLSVLDTNRNRLPADLRGRPFDDPTVIARACRLLDWVFARIPDLSLACLALGNEVDIFLGADTKKWAAYTTFFRQTSAYARTRRQGLLVGSKVTFDGLTGLSEPFAAQLTAPADVILGTYYGLGAGFRVKPHAVVASDFNRLARMARNGKKPLYLLECGCPSGAACGSSEAHQARFVRTIFQQWDKAASGIPLIIFTWLTDRPPVEVRDLARYYGLPDKAFAEYLSTLALRTWAGKGQDKAAFGALVEEVARRKL